MGYRYLLLGAGMQGQAGAYDLARFGEAEEVLLADLDLERAERVAERVNQLIRGPLVRPLRVDVRDRRGLIAALKGCDAALSAVPYRFNLEVTEAALAARTGLCDLGGDTEIVLKQMELDPRAKEVQIAIVPDCGLAPGMANVLATYAISRVEQPVEVRIWCGGLPQRPKPPLGYKLVFNIEGLTKEYCGKTYLLRGGRVVEVEALTELEEVEFPPPVGRCEAFLTSGGSSTAPWTFAGRLKVYEYKTVRYPGHCEKIRLLRELGLLEPEPVQVGEVRARARVSPRELFHVIVPPRISFPEDPDLVILRVSCRGEEGGRPVEVQLELMDFYDERTGFSAMERTTAFSAAIVVGMIARGELEPGVAPMERAVPPEPFISQLLWRGFELKEMVSRPVAPPRPPRPRARSG